LEDALEELFVRTFLDRVERQTGIHPGSDQNQFNLKGFVDLIHVDDVGHKHADLNLGGRSRRVGHSGVEGKNGGRKQQDSKRRKQQSNRIQ
jgi:hypothetical protein